MRQRAKTEGPRAVRRVESLIRDRQRREAETKATLGKYWTPEQAQEASRKRAAVKQEQRARTIESRKSLRNYYDFEYVLELAKSLNEEAIERFNTREEEEECPTQPYTFLLLSRRQK